VPDTTLPTPADKVRAYLPPPRGEPPWPGVLVVHEARRRAGYDASDCSQIPERACQA
jgi:dienelactone hydrolase